MDISARLCSVRERVLFAVQRSGRAVGDVTLLAVSKACSASQVLEAIEAGQLSFGENYVQEAKKKIEQIGQSCPGAEIRFDMTGPLQRNKVKQAVKLFDVIQTVDRLEVGTAISEAAERIEKVQQVLVQVNISEEESKRGVLAERTGELIKSMLPLPGIEVKGLMCIGAYYSEDEEDVVRRRAFCELRQLRDELEQELGCELSELSMGMSHDFELAIEEGATIVRVGNAIFGGRP